MQARSDLDAPSLAALAALDEAGFRRLFAGGPIKRVGFARFLRNVLIAIGNSGDERLAEAARNHLGHASPLVRAMAIWACGKLMSAGAFSELAAARSACETDPQARREWEAVAADHRASERAPAI